MEILPYFSVIFCSVCVEFGASAIFGFTKPITDTEPKFRFGNRIEIGSMTVMTLVILKLSVQYW